jgi:hypothetical protein
VVEEEGKTQPTEGGLDPNVRGYLIRVDYDPRFQPWWSAAAQAVENAPEFVRSIVLLQSRGNGSPYETLLLSEWEHEDLLFWAQSIGGIDHPFSVMQFAEADERRNGMPRPADARPLYPSKQETEAVANMISDSIPPLPPEATDTIHRSKARAHASRRSRPRGAK